MASSLTTVSDPRMLTAVIKDQADPLKIADLAIGKMRVKIPDLTQAPTSNFAQHRATKAKAILRRLELVRRAIADSDEVVAAAYASQHTREPDGHARLASRSYRLRASRAP